MKFLRTLILFFFFQSSFIFSDESENIQLLYKKITLLEEEIVILRNLIEENSYLIERLQELDQQRYLDIDKRIYELSLNNHSAELIESDEEVILGADEIINSDLVLFKEALELFEGSLYAEALDKFRQLIINSPEGEYSPDAYFWSGELFLAQRMLEDARESYLIIVGKYSEHKRAADSYYKLGEIAVSLEDNVAAAEYFKFVIDNYPYSAAMQLAKKSLEKIQEESNLIE